MVFIIGALCRFSAFGQDVFQTIRGGFVEGSIVMLHLIR